jgi:hypothetical protein
VVLVVLLLAALRLAVLESVFLLTHQQHNGLLAAT